MVQTTERIIIKPPGLHSTQAEVSEDNARFKVLAAGRRWGKTRLGVYLCLKVAIEGGRAWWVAPSYPIASVGWRDLTQLARQIPETIIREGDRIVRMPGGGWVQIKSADNPDSLRGEGLDFVVLDECAFMREAAWTQALRPALSDRQGGALFISTPKGRGWFWYAYQRGLDGDGLWRSWRYPTSANPYIEPSEIDIAQSGLPERVFAQEYMAEFLEDAGGVFRRVADATIASPQERAAFRIDADGKVGKQHGYVIGVDWGKQADFTVLAVLDCDTAELVYMDRFNQIDYALQRRRLFALCERFTPYAVIAERNSMGEPIIEQLERDGLPVQPFLTTNASKAEAIDALALAFERGELKIIPDRVLISELQSYEATRLPSGMLRYGAPEGMHDDCVMALAMAWQAMAKAAPLPFSWLKEVK